MASLFFGSRLIGSWLLSEESLKRESEEYVSLSGWFLQLCESCYL